MRIGIVGGLSRSELFYRRVANNTGHELEFHPGVMAGNGSAALSALVRRCDLLLVATDVNSHGAVRASRELARTFGRPVILSRRLGLGTLTQVLQQRHPAEAAAL